MARTTTHAYLRQQEQQLWSNIVPQHISMSVTQSERKRQETIFELAYTEDDFVKDLEYVNEVKYRTFLLNIMRRWGRKGKRKKK